MATGNFSSNVGGTPAVSATGTNGANGIEATTEINLGGIGVYGDGGTNGTGVKGNSADAFGVYGTSTTGTGVYGMSTGPDGSGVEGRHNRGGDAVVGSTNGPGTGVSGTSETGVGVFGKGKPAGRFDGDVEVTGDVFLTGADCAEEFDVSEAADVEPGIVMVINQDGALQPSRQAYDKRVAGVVSGAGNYRSGITLDKQPSQNNRTAIALVGKVYCKVDAQYSPIEVGDLLTTSPSQGHAMKATDPYKAFGSVIGRALSSLDRGCGLIPILVTLQ